MSRCKQDEERVVEILKRLNGAATSWQIARELGWGVDRGALIHIGYIMSSLIERGIVQKRQNVVIYELSLGLSQ